MEEVLVVSKLDVVRRPMLLDQGVLEDQRLLLRVRQHDIDALGLLDEEAHHEALVLAREVLADSRAQVLGLADVEHGALGVPKEVDAAVPGQLSGLALQAQGDCSSAITTA